MAYHGKPSLPVRGKSTWCHDDTVELLGTETLIVLCRDVTHKGTTCDCFRRKSYYFEICEVPGLERKESCK